MRATFAILLLVCAVACRTSQLGACSSDAQCPAPSICDTRQRVCAVAAGVCFPTCSAAQACDPATVTCVAVAKPDISIQAPAAGAFAEGTLTVVAVAHAPGGVQAVSFELRSGTGTLLGSAQGTASSLNPASFSGAIPLTSVPDGAATLQALVHYGSDQTLASAAVNLMVDQHPPAISMQTDGNTTPLVAGQIAAVTAKITDGAGSGVQPSSVVLRLPNHPDVAGSAGASGVFTFAVPIDDSVMASGSSGIVVFQIVASDLAGQTATLSGDPKAVLKIDRDAPLVSNVVITTTGGYTQADGGQVFDTTGGALTVRATITDFTGVANASVCLRVAGETGASCPHPGAPGASNSYTFSLPRPLSGTFDGQAVDYTIAADDALAATAGAFAAEHRAAALQHVLFDNTPPSVSVSADTTPYARGPDGGGVPIDVTATITDGTGVASAQLLSGTKTIPGSANGNTYVFKLDPTDAPVGVEGSYAFQVSAVDHLGHSSAPASGSRVIDGAPPAISALQIFKDVPDGGGVTYPAAVPNTGWTGATFVYSDTLHVQGTLSDLTGVSSATVLHVDGIDIDGGVSRGTAIPLGCNGSATCPFSVDVTLNDAGSVFHSGTSMFDAGAAVGAIPAASLQLTVDAQDTARAFGGTALPNAAPRATAARTTRYLWQNPVTTSAIAVSGLAVHPNGDVIATIDGGTGDTVFDLAADRGTTRWSFGSTPLLPDGGAGTTVGAVIGTPAIGAGNATSARILVASSIGNVHAIDPDGRLAWENITPSTAFAVGPAVTQATVAGATVDDVVVPDAVGNGNSEVWSVTPTARSDVASDNRDFHAAPLILAGEVFFASQNSAGTTTHVTKHAINTDGSLGSAVTSTANGGAPYLGLVSDGTNVYAATRGTTPTAGTLVGMDRSFTPLATFTNTSLASALAGEPTIGIDGKLYGADVGSNLAAYDAATGGRTVVAGLGGVGMVPLHGSDGHVYVPRKNGLLIAFEGSQVSWQFDPPTSILRYATMDCSGRLFVASGNVVYAFVTDDTGLADTAWPSLRRDARNTGNASKGWPKYGIRTATGCAQ